MLSVKDVNFSIQGANILNGISFEIEKGQTVGIIGPNGSGKTTLFNCISGFNLPSSGKIFWSGKDITRLSAYQRAVLGLGRVFQNFGIFREMTVIDNVVTALESRQPLWRTFFPWSRTTKNNRKEALKYLDEVGLSAKAREKASSLSGGQMRLLEIVRTLAFGADLFLLDEPTAGVSPKMKDDVAALIRKLQSLGKTVIVIEHDLNFIYKFCERIIVLDVGKVVLDDTPRAVRENEILKEIYFGAETAQT